MSEFCYLFLTAGNTVEASEIAKALLEKKLVVCSKQMPIESDFAWKGGAEHGSEILMIMESRLNLFDEVEKAVAQVHSYDTFVLEAVPIAKVSKQAQTWMNKELKK